MYRAIYKCRLCEEEFEKCATANKDIAIDEVLHVVSGIHSERPMSPYIYDGHYCKNGSIGIADFLGFKKDE